MSEPTPTLSLHIDCIAGAGTSSVPVMLESSSHEEDSESDCLSDDMQDDPDWHTVTLHQEGKCGWTQESEKTLVSHYLHSDASQVCL